MGESLKVHHAELKRRVFVVDLFIYLFHFAFAKDRNTHMRTVLCSKYTRLLIAAVGLLCCYILHLSLLCCHPP